MPPKAPSKDRFPYPRGVENNYVRALRDVFKDWLAFPGPVDSIDALFKRMIDAATFTPIQQADRIARGMVTNVARVNASHWRIAALQSSQGNRIFRALQNELRSPVGAKIEQQIKLNAMLIRTLPASIAETVSLQIDTKQRQGIRPETIAREMSARMPYIARYKIDRIARTETAKATEVITQARSQNLGLNWYQWLTAEDVRVRDSHKNMDLVLVNFNDPPSPEVLIGEKFEGKYNPGNIYNCRCTVAVLVDLDEVSWPARVYHGGKIQRMTRAMFVKIAGNGFETGIW